MSEQTAANGVRMERTVSQRILYLLNVYPGISRSMLQVAIGAAMSPTIWKPVLEQLIKEGKVKQLTKAGRTPMGRTIQHLHLYVTDPKAVEAELAAAEAASDTPEN
jgi:hypothetical protein